ncbi:MAG: hypothetical protein ABI411_20555 [Tahibacter sp.]
MLTIDGNKKWHRGALAKVTLACALAVGSVAHAGSPTQTFTVTATSTAGWTIDAQNNPTITLMRGNVYVFALQAVSGIHPFYIKTANSTGSANAFSDGVSGNGSTGTANITIDVPVTAPNSLHYNCFNHPMMNGVINVVDNPDLVFKNGFQ